MGGGVHIEGSCASSAKDAAHCPSSGKPHRPMHSALPPYLSSSRPTPQHPSKRITRPSCDLGSTPPIAAMADAKLDLSLDDLIKKSSSKSRPTNEKRTSAGGRGGRSPGNKPAAGRGGRGQRQLGVNRSSGGGVVKKAQQHPQQRTNQQRVRRAVGGGVRRAARSVCAAGLVVPLALPLCLRFPASHPITTSTLTNTDPSDLWRRPRRRPRRAAGRRWQGSSEPEPGRPRAWPWRGRRRRRRRDHGP
jgi:hypothetical protein